MIQFLTSDHPMLIAVASATAISLGLFTWRLVREGSKRELAISIWTGLTLVISAVFGLIAVIPTGSVSLLILAIGGLGSITVLVTASSPERIDRDSS